MNARVLLLTYADMYKQKFGLTYPISWAKHAALIKRILVKFGPETTTDFLKLHLTDTSEFVIKAGHSLETLPSQIPRYIATLKKAQDKPKEGFSEIEELFS